MDLFENIGIVNIKARSGLAGDRKERFHTARNRTSDEHGWKGISGRTRESCRDGPERKELIKIV